MFIYTSILAKLFFVLTSSLFVSFYRERESLKNSDNYLLLTIYYIINFFSYIVCSGLYIFEKYKDCKVIVIIKNSVKYINYMFVSGRNDLFYFLSDKVSNVFVPKNKKLMKLECKNEKVFDNDEDMMDFLEELGPKKNN